MTKNALEEFICEAIISNGGLDGGIPLGRFVADIVNTDEYLDVKVTEFLPNND